MPGVRFELTRCFHLRFLRPLRLPLRHPGAGYGSTRVVGRVAHRRQVPEPRRSPDREPDGRGPLLVPAADWHVWDTLKLPTAPRLRDALFLNFLFLLTAGPRSEALHTVSALARAAGDAGHGAEVFLAGDGVAHAGSLAGVVPVTLCEADLRWRQSQPVEIPGVTRGSLRDLARQCREADRVLVFR